MAVKVNSVDMVHGSLWGKILKFSLTYMMMAFLQELYSAADMLVVGRFAGETALAGVGTCTAVVNLFLQFILGLASGVTIVIGQAIGENSDGISKAAHTAIALAICGGAIISVICLLFTKPLLGFIDVPENVMPQAALYLRIIACGFIFSLTYNFGAGILRAKGDTKRPLYIVSASGIINVILNLVFVCNFNMGAGGVALATIISQVFTAIVILYILCHEEDKTRISLKKIRIYKKSFLRIVRYGLPSGIQASVYSLSNMVVQSSINSFGSAAMAGCSAATSVTNFYNVMVNSIYQAAIVFTSQNFGAKKFERIKKTALICISYVCVLWAMQAAISHFFGEFLIGLYAPDDPEVIRLGMLKFRIMGYTYGALGFMNVMSGVLRGMGASVINMIMAIVGVCGIRILWILTAFRAIGTIEALFCCYPLSWLGTTVLHSAMAVYTYKNKKKKLSNPVKTY